MSNKSKEVVIVEAMRTPIGRYGGSLKQLKADQLGSIVIKEVLKKSNIIKDEILKLRDEGSTIIFSTHRMESVEELCDHIALIHQSNKVLDGNLNEIKRQYKTNTFEVGLVCNEQRVIKQLISSKFKSVDANFRSLGKELKLNISLGPDQTSNELLNFLSSNAEVNHFMEVVPSANDIFIQTINNQK